MSHHKELLFATACLLFGVVGKQMHWPDLLSYPILFCSGSILIYVLIDSVRQREKPALKMTVNVNSQAWYEYHPKEGNAWYISGSFLIRFINADQSQIHEMSLDLVTKRWLISDRTLKSELITRYFS